MREPGSGIRMTVERFFNENRVAIKVEMEIGSNEAIKQAIVGLSVSIVPACFGTGRHKRSTHDSGCGRLQSKPLVCSLSRQAAICCRKHFSEYLLLKGKQIAEQTTLEVMHRT